ANRASALSLGFALDAPASLSPDRHLRSRLRSNRSQKLPPVQDSHLDHHARRSSGHDLLRSHPSTRRVCSYQLGRDILPPRNVLDRCGHGAVRTPRISHGENDQACKDSTTSFGIGAVRNGSTLSLSRQRHTRPDSNPNNVRALQTDADKTECSVDDTRARSDDWKRDDSSWESPELAHRLVQWDSKPDARLSLLSSPTNNHGTPRHIPHPQILLSERPCKIRRRLRDNFSATNQRWKARKTVSVRSRRRSRRLLSRRSRSTLWSSGKRKPWDGLAARCDHSLSAKYEAAGDPRIRGLGHHNFLHVPIHRSPGLLGFKRSPILATLPARAQSYRYSRLSKCHNSDQSDLQPATEQRAFRRGLHQGDASCRIHW